MMSIEFHPIDYGFKYGAAKVTRVASDDKKGWIVLQVETPKDTIQIYVTKTGKMRLYGKDNSEIKILSEANDGR